MENITDEHLEILNESQNKGCVHPYTCPNDADEPHIIYEIELSTGLKYGVDFNDLTNFEKHLYTQTNLIATKEGWKCPVCEWKQDYGDNIEKLVDFAKRSMIPFSDRISKD